MKIEVMVDKDATHFSYMFDCDKVIDGSRSRITGGGIDPDARLVIMRKRKHDASKSKDETIENARNEDETIAVFNVWTFWRKLPDDAEKCFRCGHHDKLNEKNLCPECQRRVPK